jgi:hypothetical protein
LIVFKKLPLGRTQSGGDLAVKIILKIKVGFSPLGGTQSSGYPIVLKRGF